MKPFHIQLIGPDRVSLSTSFEAAESRLLRLDLLCFEPDGSFVWTRHGGTERVFGMLYDAAGRLQYAELRGRCSLETFVQLRSAMLGNPLDGEPISVVRLPEGRLQKLQQFETEHWT